MTDATQLSPHQSLESFLRIGSSKCWRWYLLEGSCLALLGVASLLAMAAPTVAVSVSSEVIFLAAGAIMLVAILRAWQSPGIALSLLLAFIAFVAGAYLLWHPPESAMRLGLVFAAYFTSRGVVTVLLAAAHRRQRFSQWEWLTVSGVTSLILALMILSGLPGPFTWMLGVLLGVDLIFNGSALLAIALASNEFWPPQIRA